MKKRIVLEKELQSEIQKEVASELANRSKQGKSSKTDKIPKTPEKTLKATNNETKTPQASNNIETSPKKGGSSKGLTKQKQQRTKPTISTKKKKKLYCICQTPYDDSK